MNTDELRYFIEASKEQNLSKAARTLGTTQSTLSHAIRRLEKEFDCKLFSKTGKNLKLTLQGRKFSERAVEIIRNIHDLKDEVSSGTTPLIGHFKAAGTIGTPAQILAHALLRLNASSNSILEISNLRSSDILKRVSAKELDFGLCYEPQPYPHVERRAIAESEYVIVVRRSHPLFKIKKDKRAEALLHFSWAHPRHLPGIASCTTHPIFSQFSKQPKVRYFYDSYDVAVEILTATDAWALLPRSLLSRYSDLLRPTLEDFIEPIGLSLVWHEDGDTLLVDSLEVALKSAARLQGWRAAASSIVSQ